jgi:hypothetical protein
MKAPLSFLLLVVSALLTSCADTPDPYSSTDATEKVTVEPAATAENTIPEDSQDRVRTPEVIKAYPNGRYIDPNDPNIMHEKGITYRKEQDPQWNLDPNLPGFLPEGPVPSVSDPNKVPSPLTAEIQNQLETQKKYTASIIEQNDAMTKRLEVLSQQSDQFKSVLDQNTQLKVQNDCYQTQLADLEKKLDVLTAKPPEQPSWWDKAKKLFQSKVADTKKTDSSQSTSKQ